MKKEMIAQGKTVELATAEACKQLGVSVDEVTVQVLEEAKKGILGIGAAPAKVKVTYNVKPSEIALDFVKTVLADMNIEATVDSAFNDDGDFCININGESAGSLIGHHGDTMDSLQYLVNLAANRKETPEDDREYTRVVIDIENYRAKREQTLRTLAQKMAQKVLKYKKSLTLEPMSSQERRVIHSEIQQIDGVVTYSIGQEASRRVVIAIDKKQNS